MSEPPDNDDREAELIHRLIQRDPQALAEIFEQYRDRLRTIVRFRLDPRLAGRLDVEDVLQEAYMNAQTRLQYVLQESGGGVFIWLRMILNQTLVDIHRRHLGTLARDAGKERSGSGKSPSGTSFSMSSWLVGHLTSPSQALMRKELADQIDTALDSLSDLDREVLIFRHFEELTNVETAYVLGISEQAASIRYVRALARLQQVLEKIPGFVPPHKTDDDT
ncbi:MAG: sigma-70 family RNA polymerase sigma factor [Planctomycetales bacterium]